MLGIGPSNDNTTIAVIMSEISNRLQPFMTMKTKKKQSGYLTQELSWDIYSSSRFTEYPSLNPMWCFAFCCFPQHRSSAHQDPWFFQHLRYSHFSKFSTLSSYRIRGTTRSEIARQLLVWAYHEWRVRLYVKRAFKVLFFPEISSQNTASFCLLWVVCEK